MIQDFQVSITFELYNNAITISFYIEEQYVWIRGFAVSASSIQDNDTKM